MISRSNYIKMEELRNVPTPLPSPAVKLAVLIWDLIGTCSLLEPAPSGWGGQLQFLPLDFKCVCVYLCVSTDQVGLVVGLLFAFLVVLPTVLLLFYCYRVKTSYYHKWISQRDKNKKKKYRPPVMSSVMSSVCLSITASLSQFHLSWNTKPPKKAKRVKVSQKHITVSLLFRPEQLSTVEANFICTVS